MIQYNGYKEKEGGFLKLQKLIPNEGDSVRLKCVDGQIKDGSFGVKQLVIDIILTNAEGQGERRSISCDAPDEKNEMSGSQIYRGFCDNNIQPNDVFEIVNGGQMNNQYKTVIYEVRKDATQPAPQTPPQATQAPIATQEEQVEVLTGEPTVEPVQDTREAPLPEEDVRIEDIPF